MNGLLSVASTWSRMSGWLVPVMVAALSAGCAKKSGVGETCQTTDDCSGSLRCLDMKCVAKAKAGENCEKADDCSDDLACLDRECVDKGKMPNLQDLLGSCWEFSTPVNGAKYDVRFVQNDNKLWQIQAGDSRWRPQNCRMYPGQKCWAYPAVYLTGEENGVMAFLATTTPAVNFKVRPIDYSTVEADETLRWMLRGTTTRGPIRLSKVRCATSGW